MASSRGRHVARHSLRRQRRRPPARLDLVFVVAVGLLAAAGNNPLTGIEALDLFERGLIGAAVGFATWKHGPTRQLLGVASIAAAMFIETNDGPGGLLLGAGSTSVVLLLVADPIGRRVGRYAVVAGLVLLAPTAALALTARSALDSARARLETAQSELTADERVAGATVDRALRDVRRAQARVSNPVTKLARLVPFAGQQLVAARELVGTVERVVAAAKTSIDTVDLGSLKLDNGRVPVERIHALAEPTAALARASGAAHEDATAIRRRFLIPQLDSAAADIAEQAIQTERTATLLSSFAQQAPDLFGLNGVRRYFMVVQQPAEARASGGILGAFAEVTAENGKLDLARVGSDRDLNEASAGKPRPPIPGFERAQSLQPARFWQNFTSSPDFPTVAKVIEAEYALIARPLDGVISVDPVALAALLDLVGPVTVPDWPEPVTKDNAVRIFEHDQYVQFANPADFPKREAFMATAVGAIWEQLVTGSPSLDRLDALGDAVKAGSIFVHATRDPEQELLRDAGLDGAMPAVGSGDVLAVTTHNASGNKTDWFLHRTVDYRPRITGTRIEADLTITLRNDAPASGEPNYVIAYLGQAGELGHNRTFLSVHTPWKLDGAEFTDVGAVFPQTERGLNVYAIELDLPPKQTRTVKLRLSGAWDGGDYALTYRPQALVNGDTLKGFPDLPGVSQVVTRGVGQSSALRWYLSGTN